MSSISNNIILEILKLVLNQESIVGRTAEPIAQGAMYVGAGALLGGLLGGSRGFAMGSAIGGFISAASIERSKSLFEAMEEMSEEERAELVQEVRNVLRDLPYYGMHQMLNYIITHPETLECIKDVIEAFLKRNNKCQMIN